MKKSKQRSKRSIAPEIELDFNPTEILPFDLDPVKTLAEADFFYNFFEGIGLIVSMNTTTLVLTIHGTQGGERR